MADSVTDQIGTAIGAGRLLAQPVHPTAETDVLVVPRDHVAVAIEGIIGKFRDKPARLQTSVRLDSPESFIAYVETFKTAQTRVFYAVSQCGPPVFGAIMDYHEADGQAAWCEHRATYAPKFTPEWERWLKVNGVHMGQQALGELIEENQRLIVEPPGAELLELVMTLEGSNNIRCNSLMRLESGRAVLNYEQDVTLKGNVSTRQGQIAFPSNLQLALPPFEGARPYPVTCRLRYRIPNRQLEFWYEVVEPHLILEDAAKGIAAQIEEGLKVKLWRGMPA